MRTAPARHRTPLRRYRSQTATVDLATRPPLRSPGARLAQRALPRAETSPHGTVPCTPRLAHHAPCVAHPCSPRRAPNDARYASAHAARSCRRLVMSRPYVRAPRHMRQSVENSIEEPLDDSIAGSVDHSPPQEAIRGSGSTRSIPGNNARRRVEGRSAGERAEDIADTSHWLPERPARCLSRGAGCIRARADASVRAQSRNARDRSSGDIVDAAMPRSHVAIREAAIAAVRSSFGDCALRSRGGPFSRRRRCACPCVRP